MTYNRFIRVPTENGERIINRDHIVDIQPAERGRSLMALSTGKFLMVELPFDKFVTNTDQLNRIAKTSVSLGMWMSAALDDPNVCGAMKQDIVSWLEAMDSWGIYKSAMTNQKKT